MSDHDEDDLTIELSDNDDGGAPGSARGGSPDCRQSGRPPAADAAGAMSEDDLEISLSEPEAEAVDAAAAAGEPPAWTEGEGTAISLKIPRKGSLIPRKGDSSVVPDVVIADDSETESHRAASLAQSAPTNADCQVLGEKRALKRNEMDEVCTHFKKGKRAGDAGVEMRNLMKVKLQEMTPEEMQAVISFPPPARGLGPKRLVIHMRHPRILEPPHSADLILFLHAELDALLAGGSKFLWTDRCSGFMAFVANLSCLFTGCEAQGVSVAKLGRFLTGDRDLNSKVLAFVSRLMLAPEVDAHLSAGRAAAGGGGGWAGTAAAVPGETDAQRENMAGILWHALQLLHNYIEFEMQFADESKYQILTQELVAHSQLMLLYQRSLDMLEMRCLRGPWGNYIKDMLAAQSAAAASKSSKAKHSASDTPKISQSCKPRLFAKVLEFWLDLLVRSPLVSSDQKREARKMLVKHPGLALVVRMLVQRLQRSDDMGANCIEMLDFLAFSRKFIRVLGSDKAFGEVRESMADLVLSRAVRLVSVSEEDFGALELLHILNQLLFEDEMRACVLCRVSVRERLLELVGVLLKGLDRMVEMANGSSDRERHKDPEGSKGSPSASAKEEAGGCGGKGAETAGSAAAGGGGGMGGAGKSPDKLEKAAMKRSEMTRRIGKRFLAVFRLLARLARDDARPLAAALYEKFGNTEQSREKLVLSLMVLTDSGLIPEARDDEDKADRKWFAKIVALLTQVVRG